MTNHKLQLTFTLFVISFIFFSGSTLPADAEIFCHAAGGSYNTLDTGIAGFDNHLLHHSDDKFGQECLLALCPEGQIFSEAENQCVPLPTISINDVSQVEGDSDNTFTFTITRTGITNTAISVEYDTSDGPGLNSASAESDYISIVNGTANIADGETSVTVDITVKGDIDVESNETFTVTLSLPALATIDDGQGLGTIENDDQLRTT
jgi:hypothetical protein